MKRVSAAIRVGCLGLTCALLWSAAGTAVAMAQTAAPPDAPATLTAVDFNFVGQANLGAPFQVDFPKSRVHAKLLGSLILECYQTIKVRPAWTIGEGRT